MTKKSDGPLLPADVLARAAASPGGIVLRMGTKAEAENFRKRLHRERTTIQRRLDREWAAAGDPTAPLPTTGWDDLRVMKRGPRTLWIGVPTAETYGIESIEEA